MVTVHFLGVVRLRWGLKEQQLDLPAPLTLAELIDRIVMSGVAEMKRSLRQQSYLVADPNGQERLYRLPQDLGAPICDGSVVTVVTPLTGG